MRYSLGDTILQYSNLDNKATSGFSMHVRSAPRFSSGISRRASRSSARFKVYALVTRFPFATDYPNAAGARLPLSAA